MIKYEVFYNTVKCIYISDGSKSCYGGMPRHAAFFKKHVDTSANNLIVSGGDWFTGEN